MLVNQRRSSPDDGRPDVDAVRAKRSKQYGQETRARHPGHLVGYIAGGDTRYHYNFWRPITAIRAGDSDGNDATAGDPGWETFMNTPPLPDYPSTHSVAGGASAVVLAGFFGADQVAFSMTSGVPFAGITRSFTSFSQASQENADSRIYSGIHFRTSVQDGIKQGEQIGHRAFAQYLLPYRK